ncbi:hypothetical protein KI387_039481, partial [Taxus chinensis]
MNVRMNMSRDVSPDRAKMPMQPRQKQMKKVQVVYYLSRGGQLEHPHFMEISLPCNQELRLRDVINRLTIMRGKGVLSLFSWSCKRSYKSGYVWHDLSDDDVICPVDGVEYVLKGSEVFQTCPEKCQETRSPKTVSNAIDRPPIGVYSHDRKSVVPKRRILTTESAARIPPGHGGLLSPKLPFSQNVSPSQNKVIPREEDIGNISTRSEPPQYRPRAEEKSPKSCIPVNREYNSFKFESMDSTAAHGGNSGGRITPTKKDEEDSEGTQNSTELSGGEESPRSSSFASFTEAQAHDESHEPNKQSSKSVRFEEPNTSQSSTRFSLLHFISCGSLAVNDDNSLTINPLRPARRVSLISTTKNQCVNRTLGEELDCTAEDLRIANAQIAEKEYFSSSIVEMKTGHGQGETEASDPTLTKSASYNAEIASKSEIGGVMEKEERGESGGGGKIKCIPTRRI